MNVEDRVAVTRSQLSELALNAAIELEKSTDLRTGNPETISRFFQTIKQQLCKPSQESIFRDQTLYPVYAFALDQSFDSPMTSRDSISTTLCKIIDNMENPNSNQSSTKILSKFCLAVHEALISDLIGRRISTVRQDDRIR